MIRLHMHDYDTQNRCKVEGCGQRLKSILTEERDHCFNGSMKFTVERSGCEKSVESLKLTTVSEPNSHETNALNYRGILYERSQR